MRRFVFAFVLLWVHLAFQIATLNAADIRTVKIVDLFVRVNPAVSKKQAEKYAAIILEAGKKFNVDPYVIAAIIVHESTVKYNAVSKGGDYGLMQIHWKAHYKTLQARYNIKSAKGLFDAKINIFFGTEIFADCMKKATGTPPLWSALMRYSAGSRKLADKVLATVKELNK